MWRRRLGIPFRHALRALGVSDEAPVLLGGSTFEGEEQIVADVFKQLRTSYPNLFLILVPRHFERASDVAAQLEKSGLAVARRTQPPPASQPAVLLVDTTGELRDWYSCATVVFVGKSLTARGGQNPAEPVAAGVPVVFGPHMQNFATLTAQFLRHRGGIEIHDCDSLRDAIGQLLESPSLRSQMAENAACCLTVHSGATGRTVSLLNQIA